MIKNRALWIVGSLVAAVVATALIMLVSPTRTGPSSARVKIELRGKPVAKLRMNGKSIGTTPTTIIVPRGTQPLELEATFTVEKIGLPQPTKKVETYRQIRMVVPDAEQSVDFAIADADKIDVTVERR